MFTFNELPRGTSAFNEKLIHLNETFCSATTRRHKLSGGFGRRPTRKMIASGKSFVSDQHDTHAADPTTRRSAWSQTDEPACLQPKVIRVETVAAHRSLFFYQACELQDKLFSQEAASRHLSHRASACFSNKH